MPPALDPQARLVVFDLDGTLVDTIDDLTASANRLLARLGGTAVDADIVRPMVGDGVPALVRRLLVHAGLSTDPERATHLFAADYADHAADASRLFPGMRQTLTRLRAAGFRLAVCTNKPVAAARTLLEALGVMKLLAAVGGGDSFPTRKPDPGHLLGTIEAAGARPQRSLLVGDHANDVVAARAAGVACIFALWGYGTAAMSRESTAQAQNAGEIPGLAEALLPAVEPPTGISPPG